MEEKELEFEEKTSNSRKKTSNSSKNAVFTTRLHWIARTPPCSPMPTADRRDNEYCHFHDNWDIRITLNSEYNGHTTKMFFLAARFMMIMIHGDNAIEIFFETRLKYFFDCFFSVLALTL